MYEVRIVVEFAHVVAIFLVLPVVLIALINAVEIARHHGYGGLGDEGIDLVYYKQTQRLEENRKICNQISSHGMMTCRELDMHTL